MTKKNITQQSSWELMQNNNRLKPNEEQKNYGS